MEGIVDKRYDIRSRSGELLISSSEDMLDKFAIPYAEENNCIIIDRWDDNKVIYPPREQIEQDMEALEEEVSATKESTATNKRIKITEVIRKVWNMAIDGK